MDAFETVDELFCSDCRDTESDLAPCDGVGAILGRACGFWCGTDAVGLLGSGDELWFIGAFGFICGIWVEGLVAALFV